MAAAVPKIMDTTSKIRIILFKMLVAFRRWPSLAAAFGSFFFFLKAIVAVDGI
jgi:hypothetical protein